MPNSNNEDLSNAKNLQTTPKRDNGGGLKPRQPVPRPPNPSSGDSKLNPASANEFANSEPSKANVLKQQHLELEERIPVSKSYVLGEDEFVKHWKKDFPTTYNYLHLFRYSTAWERVKLLVGILAAILGGVFIPLFIFFQGELIEEMVEIIHAELILNVCDEEGGCNSGVLQSFLMSCKHTDPTNLTQEKIVSHATKALSNFSIRSSILATGFLFCSATYFSSWHSAANSQISRIRKKYFESILRKDITWFDTERDPDSINNLLRHTKTMISGMGENITISINLASICICCLIISASTREWHLSLLGLVAVGTLILTSLLVHWTSAHKIAAEINSYKFAHAHAHEVFNNIKSVIFYHGQQKELVRYNKDLRRSFLHVRKWILISSIAVLLLWMINIGMWASIVFAGLKWINHSYCNKKHYEQIGNLFKISISFIFGAGNIYMIFPVLISMNNAKKNGEKIFRIIDQKSQIDNLVDEGVTLSNLRGQIEFEDVQFTYPTGSGNLVLNHLSFRIEANTNTAIVGLNGAGKSTILKLICKEYLPDSGFIKIDGVDIRKLNTKWLRSQFGVVPQRTSLFDDTIENNIRMGRVGASFFEVQDASRQCGAHDFIVSLKNAYQTRVGPSGQRLAPGQEQKIMLARALLRDPRVLLMDEPTSILDSLSESRVFQAINNFKEKRTVVMITHRLDQIKKFDNIIVVRSGKAIETGTHQALLKNNSLYNHLATGKLTWLSRSTKSATAVESFDSTDVCIIQNVKLFSTKIPLPNLYNDLLSLESTSVMLVRHYIHKALLMPSNPHYNDETEAATYKLESQDSIQSVDKLLTRSELRELYRPSRDIPGVKELNPNDDSEDIDIADYIQLNDLPWWETLWLTTKSSCKIYLLVVIATSVCIGILIPCFGYLFVFTIQAVIDPDKANDKVALFLKSVYAGSTRHAVWTFCILGFCGGLIAGLQDFFLNLSNFEMIAFIRKKVFTAIMRQDLAFFETVIKDPAILRDLLGSQVPSLKYVVDAIYMHLTQTVFSLTTALILTAGAFDHGNLRGLAGLGFLTFIFVTFFTYVDGWLARCQLLATRETMDDHSKLLLEIFKEKHNVILTQLEPYLLEKFYSNETHQLRKRRKIGCLRTLTFPLAQTASLYGTAFFIFLSTYYIQHPSKEFPYIIGIAIIYFFTLISTGMNLSIFNVLRVSMKAGESVLNVTKREPAIVNDTTGTILDTCVGKIDFIRTHFWHTYSGDNPLLNGVTLHIPPGKTVAIVGSSESGKSAFLDLICRLYDPTKGVVTLDYQPINEFNILTVREHMGYVDKTPKLFERTVAENIAYGDNLSPVSMDNVFEVTKKIKLHNFICSLPAGYETRIGSPTERLTSAQKFSILIARALLRNPEVLLIDELEVEVEREGEAMINRIIDEARIGRTCVIIGHHLAAVKKADMIIVMKDGFVAEKGTHSELIKLPNGVYAEIWKARNPMESSGKKAIKTTLTTSTQSPQTNSLDENLLSVASTTMAASKNEVTFDPATTKARRTSASSEPEEPDGMCTFCTNLH